MKEYIKQIVQNIVNRNFATNIERHIITHDDRLNFRCPYCNEGRTKSKKRGNIYFNHLMYVCFRCNKKTTVDKLFLDFQEVIAPDKKMEIIAHLESNISYKDFEGGEVGTSLDNLISLRDIETVIENGGTEFTEFTPIKPNGGIFKYLVNRGIAPKYHLNFYQAKMWRKAGEYEWVIVMLNRREDYVLGMQVRNLKDGRRRMFKIYNYESLVEFVSPIREYDISLNEIVVYNKLSYFFNIMNIDFMETVHVFEGYIDSLFFPNSIGLVGVNTDTKFIENNAELRYVYDNDNIGNLNANRKITSGQSVFLWKKLFMDIARKRSPYDPMKLFHRINKVKDMNSLEMLVPNCYTTLNLANYFSLDVYDKIHIEPYKPMKKISSPKGSNFDNI